MDTLLEINNRSRIFGTRSVTRLEEELEGVEEGGELLVLLLIVFSSVNLTVTLVYQVVVVLRASRTSPSRRHLFLSQALLLGLLLGSSLGLVHSLEQTAPTCVAIRLGTGLSYVLIYSSLLVKQVFLISLNTGVYLPAMYQALLFSFCVLVQLVMGVQWVVLVPPCDYTTSDHITSLSYIIFLLVFISCLAIKTVHIKDNNHESRHIAVLMLVTVIVWLAWMLGASLLPEEQQTAVIGLGLQTCCLATFLAMFLPGRRRKLLGREGYFREAEQDSLDSELPGKRGRGWKPSQGSYLGFHRPLGVVPPASPGQLHYPPSPSYFYSTPYYSPSHFYPDKLYQCWPPPPHHTYGTPYSHLPPSPSRARHKTHYYPRY